MERAIKHCALFSVYFCAKILMFLANSMDFVTFDVFVRHSCVVNISLKDILFMKYTLGTALCFVSIPDFCHSVHIQHIMINVNPQFS